MSRPRAISELTITPLYQYTDHEPPIDHARRVDRAAIEERDLLRVRRVGPVEHRDAALVPGLHHHVAARDRNQRAVVRDAVLLRRLRRRHLVVALELHLVVRVDREDRVGAPLLRIGRAALRRAAAAPLVGEQHLGAVVVERGRVPVGEVRVGDGVDAHRVRRDRGCRAAGRSPRTRRRRADRRIHRDVVALRRAGVRIAGAAAAEHLR